jgi:hypothetical protein
MADGQSASEPEPPKRDNAELFPRQSSSWRQPDGFRQGDARPAKPEKVLAARAGPAHSIEAYGDAVDPFEDRNRVSRMTAAGDAFAFERRSRRRQQKLDEKTAFIIAKAHHHAA